MCGIAKYGKLFLTVRMVFHNTKVEDVSMRAPLSGIQIKFCPVCLLVLVLWLTTTGGGNTYMLAGRGGGERRAAQGQTEER